jgi:competence protein ComEC
VGASNNRLYDLLTAERDRWVLWLPVGMGCGICLYFLLPQEPSVLVGPVSVLIAVIIWILSRKTASARISKMLTGTGVALILLGIGLTAAKVRTLNVAATVLQDAIGPTTLSGRIETIETFPVGLRLTLGKPDISGLQPYQTPDRLTLRLRGKQPETWPGDWIRVRARLSPPSAPAAPGAFDFQRQAFFKGIGAVGFGLGKVDVIALAPNVNGAGGGYFVARLRHHISSLINAALPNRKGGFAAALMTGEKRAVDEKTVQNLRDAGLAHLLSISGLHVGLVAGIIFAGLRFFLALTPFIGLRYPIKKWAAIAAIMGAFCYALIAGATLPTQRAFLMLSLVLIAVVFDRRGISMRSLAWAAVAVLLVQPESLLGPSFQMSFAAVMALIAVYEAVTLRSRKFQGDRTTLPRPLRTAGIYIAGIGLTTLVAGLATAPYSAFHFNRFADYSLVANLLAVPVTALWVMPFAVVAFILMPFGLEGLALGVMGWGLDLVMKVAETVAGWPGSVTLLPAMPDWGLATISFGMIWLCLWQTKWRFWGAVPLAFGMVSLLMTHQPDLLVDGRGQVVAVKSGAGELRFSNLVQARHTRETWARRAGQGAMSGFNTSEMRVADRFSCDSTGCLYRSHHQTIAISRSPASLIEDCWQADVVISLLPIRRLCPAGTVIDRFDLWREGTHAIWISDDGIKVRTVNSERGDRPWVLKRAVKQSRSGSSEANKIKPPKT